ncbi:MAG: hypoxanthine phosphoribosyltransferase [Bacteroidetes bacterium]|nr:hypoxanthine phosphoribosyltransferase [Bacteroidota bacterium]
MAKKKIIVNNELFESYIDEKKIQARIRQLGKKISKDFEGKTPIFIGILNGAYIFFADLIRRITIECEVDFMKLSSYGDSKITSGNVHLLKDLNSQVKNRHIIVVEDIVDTGLSIDFIKRILNAHQPASVSVVSLLVKPKSLKIPTEVDYIGFNIPSEFVLGYGLDYAQKGRNIPSIYKIAKQ